MYNVQLCTMYICYILMFDATIASPTTIVISALDFIKQETWAVLTVSDSWCQKVVEILCVRIMMKKTVYKKKTVGVHFDLPKSNLNLF